MGWMKTAQLCGLLIFFDHAINPSKKPVKNNNAKHTAFCYMMPGCKIEGKCNIGQGIYVHSIVIYRERSENSESCISLQCRSYQRRCFFRPCIVFTNVTNPRIFIDREF